MTQPPTGPSGSGQAAQTADSNEEDGESSPITRAAVLANALEIIDRDGVEGCRCAASARRSAVIRWCCIGMCRTRPPCSTGWSRWSSSGCRWTPQRRTGPSALRDLAHDFRDLARAHPNVVPLLVTRPLATPLGMRPQGILRHLEDVLALLTGAGFTGVDAVHVYRALFGFLYGHVLTELQEIVERPEETDHVLRLGLHRLPISEFPHLRDLAPTWASYDGLAELDRGLDILLSGLAAQLGLPDGAPAQAPRPGST